MATITSDNEYLRAVKVALKRIVKPWEILCGLTDIGSAYVPDIYAKTPEAYEEHIDSYMDAPTPVINKKTGEVREVDWNDPDLDQGMKSGRYIELQKKPAYAR